jgi:signal transduction histidine kinase
VILTEVAYRGGGALTYVVFPALIWAALRFGQRGATVAVAVTVLGALHGSGPFRYGSITQTLLSTQLYIAVAALSSLALAAVVAERERFADRLGESRGRLVVAADTARKRFEHDLHDGAQQGLTALAVMLEQGAADSRAHPERGAALFDEAGDQLAVVIADLRQLAHGLHPSVLTQFGLASAVRDLVSRSTVPVSIDDLPAGRLDPTAEATAYFVFAEALTNVQRHAHATIVRVRLSVGRRSLHVVVADDGVGGATQLPRSGLQGLRDRVEATGGRFDVSSPVGRGTTIRASIPLAAPDSDGAD